MSINREDWLRALADVQPASDDDAVTMREFAACMGVGETAAKVRMRRLMEAGRATRARRRIIDELGRAQWVPAYRLVDQS